MISAIISFFGGSVFRMIWGEISSIITKSQDHRQELDRMKMQGELDTAAHARQMEMARFEADKGVQMIHVQGEVDLTKIDADTFKEASESINRLTGIFIIDLWKGLIQPALATEMMVLITLYYSRHNWELDERGWELAGAVLGVFIADRLLFRRGK